MLGKDARFSLSLYFMVEILGNASRNCDEIKGICVLVSECKISQIEYADDATIILDGWEKSMLQSFSLLGSFASISRLTSYEKTEPLWIGAMRFQRREIAAHQNIPTKLKLWESGYLPSKKNL